MQQSISFCQFTDAFRDHDRKNQFSYDALRALYDYLEDLYNTCYDHEYSLDVIALCCEYTEYEDLEDFQSNYGSDYNSIESIQDETIVIMINDDSFIIQDF